MRPLTESQLRRMAKRSYMNERQREFFHRLLLTLRQDTRRTMDELQASLRATVREPDEADQAAQEEEQRLVLRALDRDSQLLDKIDAALRRLATGEYGYCRETGEPIGIERLLARPTAEYAIDAKTRRESVERHYRDG
ncbi:RNA polymerase-binding protein DksA [Alloalcanivorax sp. C16-2]|uniref:RNA polymerase-binding protein DksA n=1 Tax=Alloalcanivorax TaxID=3020832 RepID=UPI0019346215|nr:RNA polymerase-binding protein DksA [Alloalcanivorax marinus]MBL7249586.1 RNA polymerase-binding protein DksA [Alloalcanivorax marinus]